MHVLRIPGATVIRTRVVCIRRRQRYSLYPLLLTYVTDTEPLRSEMNTLLLFCQASEEKKKTMPWCNASQLSSQWIWKNKITKLSVQKNLDGSWWLSRTSISKYIFFFFFTVHCTISTSTDKIILDTSLYLQHLFCVSVSW